MKQLTCEMCGGTDLVKQDGMFVCETCGTKYSVEEAKKMMIEGNVDVSGSTIKVDSTKKLNNLYQLARRARDAENSETAARYYNDILMEAPNDWEAAFYSAYYSAMNCKIAGIGSAAYTFGNAIDGILKLIYDNDSLNKNDCYIEVVSRAQMLHGMYKSNIINNANGYSDPSYSIKFMHEHCEPNDKMLMTVADSVLRFFDDKTVALTLYKYIYSDCISDRLKSVLESKIKELDPSFVVPVKYTSTSTSSSGGCYVATAVYGSYDCPEVWTLRRYRDNYLAKTWYGRAFIYTYYAVSPTIVKYVGHTKWFNLMWKSKLDRMVKNLQDKGYKSTPYNDRDWRKDRKVER